MRGHKVASPEAFADGADCLLAHVAPFADRSLGKPLALIPQGIDDVELARVHAHLPRKRAVGERKVAPAVPHLLRELFRFHFSSPFELVQLLTSIVYLRTLSKPAWKRGKKAETGQGAVGDAQDARREAGPLGETGPQGGTGARASWERPGPPRPSTPSR